MAPQSNPDSTTAAADGVPVDSPSHDDLQALIPDMELLEAGAIDARTTQAAIAAAAGSGRKPSAAPKLNDRATATTVRIAAPRPVISDDPYADLMPELETFDEPAPTRPRAARGTRSGWPGPWLPVRRRFPVPASNRHRGHR